MKITGRDNQRLKSVRKIRDGKITDKIFIEGIRLAEEALRSDLKILEAFVSDGISQNDRSQELIEKIRFSEAELIEVSQKIFKTVTATKNSQGIVLIAQTPKTGQKIIESRLNDFQNPSPIVILLHQINNPSNLGAILRTAEAAGVSGVILTKNSTSAFSSKAIRSAMGASFRLPIWNDVEFFDVVAWAREKGFLSVCADINSEKNYLDFDFQKPILLVFGSEAHGLTKEERNSVDVGVKILLENEVESLNLAVSCGAILFEAKRQKERKGRA